MVLWWLAKGIRTAHHRFLLRGSVSSGADAVSGMSIRIRPQMCSALSGEYTHDETFLAILPPLLIATLRRAGSFT
jgi:hypothetical protein